jgi:DNA-binding response OmpR family regulator
MMPNFDGVKMLQVLKVLDDLKTIPVIVISGNTNKRNVISSIEAGADRVISKPLQKDVILKNVGEILGEDFLASHKKGNSLTEQDNKDIIHKLREFFINSFQLKRDGIQHALQSKNSVLLRAIIHEIKGTGGAIGYPELTKISTEVETLLRSTNVDWDLIKNKCDKILSIAAEIESSFICL